MKLSRKVLALGLLGSLFAASSAYATTQSVTANISFEAAVALNKTTDINFGTVQVGSGTYTITTAGAVSASNGGVLINQTGASAGSITVSGSATQTVSISTGAYAANLGVLPSAATCKYGTGSETACDIAITGQTAPGAGTTLKVGVQVQADGSQTAGQTATPTFVVTVIYG